MTELYVFDLQLNVQGEISEYESLEVERNFFDISKMVLRVPKSRINANLLKVNNIITLKDDLSYGYIIQHFSVIKEESDIIEIFAFSLNYLLGYRTIMQQMIFSGDVVRVIENFIRFNCIQVPTYRQINLLTINESPLLGTSTQSSSTGGTVFEHVSELGFEYGLGVEILINQETKTFYTSVIQGRDLSINQTQNTPLIFSLEFDNVLQQTYFESYTEYKNVAVIAGEGEGINRTVVTTNDTISGLQRRELYVDARDLSSTFVDENDVEVNLTPEQYRNVLIQRGLEALKDYNLIKTFESTVDSVQYNYNVGDIVTFMDAELGITEASRVNSISYTYNRDGLSIKPSFGTGMPKRN